MGKEKEEGKEKDKEIKYKLALTPGTPKLEYLGCIYQEG